MMSNIDKAVFSMRNAKKRLSQSGVRLSLILGIFIIVAASMLALLGVDAIAYFADIEYYEPVLLAAVWLFALPVCFGYRAMAADICRGGEGDLRILFSAFSSFKKLVSVYAIGLISLLRYAVAAFFPIFAYMLGFKYDMIPDFAPWRLEALAVLVLSLLLCVLWLFATSALSAAPHLLAHEPRLGFVAVFKKIFSERDARRSVKGTAYIIFCNVPMILLSILTVGILFVCHTVPLITLTLVYNSSEYKRKVETDNEQA